MIKMFEQTAALAAGYTATLFITMILAMVLLSAFGLRLTFTENRAS